MKFLTERLVLRTITELDSHDILEIRSNPEINQFLQRNPPKNSLDALEFILNIQRKSANKQMVFFGISLKNPSKLIGSICLWKFSEDGKTAELGYELLPNFHRKGLMTEALNFMVDYGFKDLALNQIEAFTQNQNFGSIQLLQKSKFILNEARQDEKFPENLIFELKKPLV